VTEWFSLYWGAVAMLLPFYFRFNQYNDLRICKNFAFFAAFCASFMLFGIGNLKVNPKTKISLLLLSILSWFNHNDFYNGAALEQTVIFNVFLLFLYQMLTFDIKIGIIFNFCRVGAIVQALFFWMHYFKFNPYNPSVEIWFPVGVLGQQTLSAALLAACAPMFLFGGWRIALPLIISGVVISTSAMSLVSLAVGLYIVIFRKFIKSIFFYLTPIIALVACYFLFRHSSFLADNMRYEVWSGILSQFSESSAGEVLAGRGLGDFWINSKFILNGQRFTYVHNEFIESIWAFGVVGTLLILSLLLYLRNIKSHESFVCLGIIASCLVNSYGNFTFHISSIAVILIIAYSYLVTKKSEGEVI
jgi:hypothetical protein